MHGYEIATSTSVKSVNKTPLADNFNIISKNSTQHQKLVTDVEKKLISMGLVLKSSKCRSLTLKSGKPVNTIFYLKEDSDNPTPIESVLTKPMKFLGSEVTENNSPNAMFAMIFSKLKTKLENINKSTLRGENKVNIFARYALPSMRYYMSVHHITRHMKPN